MSELLGGDRFGQSVRQRASNIKAFKKDDAKLIAKLLGLTGHHHVLEIGVGSGLLALEIAPLVAKFYGCDISSSFIEEAQRQCAPLENAQFTLIENYNLEFLQDHSVDRVFAAGVFVYLNVYEIYLYFKEMQRVLKPKGIVCANFAYGEHFRNGLTPFFLKMAKRYEKTKGDGIFIHWISPHAINAIAEHFNFNILYLDQKYMIFVKKGR